jgi:hypothetical protein
MLLERPEQPNPNSTVAEELSSINQALELYRFADCASIFHLTSLNIQSSFSR